MQRPLQSVYIAPIYSLYFNLLFCIKDTNMALLLHLKAGRGGSLRAELMSVLKGELALQDRR